MAAELKYNVDTLKFSQLKGKIEIPKFQRGVVWGDKKREKFIKTLKAGLPIGVLLLAPTKEGKFLVIDGLQRFTTMLDYSKDFFKYIDREEITDYDLMSIVVASESAREIFDGFAKKAQQEQFEIMRDVVINSITSGQGKNETAISAEAAEELCRRIAALPKEDTTKILVAVSVVVRKVFENADISDITIPVIIFNGPKDELADIFQKLNQEGVKLSKYDVFAATWIDKFVEVKGDSAFIEHIIKKYEIAQRDSDLEITDYDPDEMKKNGVLTVFEYAFAVGKALMGKCEKLFSENKDEKVDAIGFLILAELLGLSYQDMGKLADRICSYEKFDAAKFKDAILDAARVVEESLCPYIEAPSKGRGGKRASLACHSDLQLASFIIVVFKLKYALTDEGELVTLKSKELPRVREFLYKHYLYDILRGFWAGSGDSKLEDLIADPTTCRYTKDVAKAEFELVVGEWLKNGNEKKSLKNISGETRLFLNYLLRKSGAYNDKINYDVEHCVPQDTLKAHFIKKGIEVPISAPCNLVYIPASENRSKGDLTYYQRKTSNPGTYTLNQAQLDTLGYPVESELEFVKATATLTEDNYVAFLKERKTVISNKFIAALYE